ncbi:hypothetical protein NDU88_002681 [Pleurodeles waltl]|uniref:Uncharacterized protein n=1 Tax=Pleurodeles waltl TaxID=8319 RepID=A0AAV7W020_PLEWA|nr:hypothetical protein NDU88_002681 [Pleurodeles waltl]
MPTRYMPTSHVTKIIIEMCPACKSTLPGKCQCLYLLQLYDQIGYMIATFSGYMEKRKAVDPLDPLTDYKRQKKRSLKLVTKTKGSTHKPFEEMDQLFEEVEVILNCTAGNNGAPPLKNSLVHPGRIQDFFEKKMKDQVSDPALTNSGVVPITTYNTTPFHSKGLTTTASDPLSRSGSLQVEVEGRAPTPAIPLSPW